MKSLDIRKTAKFYRAINERLTFQKNNQYISNAFLIRGESDCILHLQQSILHHTCVRILYNIIFIITSVVIRIIFKSGIKKIVCDRLRHISWRWKTLTVYTYYTKVQCCENLCSKQNLPSRRSHAGHSNIIIYRGGQLREIRPT